MKIKDINKVTTTSGFREYDYKSFRYPIDYGKLKEFIKKYVEPSKSPQDISRIRFFIENSIGVSISREEIALALNELGYRPTNSKRELGEQKFYIQLTNIIKVEKNNKSVVSIHKADLPSELLVVNNQHVLIGKYKLCTEDE